MKFCQILVHCMTSITNMILVQCWRLKLVPGPFIFTCALFTFLKKDETLESSLIGYWIIGAGC